MLLELDRITAGYGGEPVLHHVSLQVETGEVVCIIGPNGAGKSTILRVIAGQLTPTEGRVQFDKNRLLSQSIAERGRMGLVYVPQGMNIFPNLTVIENLEIAGLLQDDKAAVKRAIKEVLDRYPEIGHKKNQFARDLSGGQRQILALGRIRILKPRLMLLDEPSLGLAPFLVDYIFEEIIEISRMGVSVLLVEQNAKKALSVSERGYVLELGKNRLTGTGAELLNNEQVQRLYLGG